MARGTTFPVLLPDEMEGKAVGAAGLLSVLVAAIGLALYIAVLDQHLSWPWISDVAVFAGGLVLLVVGHAVTRRWPMLGTVFITCWIIAPAALGAAVSAAIVWAGVATESRLEAVQKAEAITVAEAVTALITGIGGVIILTALRDPTSWLWPAVQTKAAFGKAFRDRFKSDSAPYRAVYEDFVYPENSNPRKEIEGWWVIARIRRAQVISTAARQGSTEKTCPAAPAEGELKPGHIEQQLAATAKTAESQGSNPKAPVFRHGNCPVHHRSAGAMARCRNP